MDTTEALGNDSANQVSVSQVSGSCPVIIPDNRVSHLQVALHKAL